MAKRVQEPRDDWLFSLIIITKVFHLPGLRIIQANHRPWLSEINNSMCRFIATFCRSQSLILTFFEIHFERNNFIQLYNTQYHWLLPFSNKSFKFPINSDVK